MNGKELSSRVCCAFVAASMLAGPIAPVPALADSPRESSAAALAEKLRVDRPLLLRMKAAIEKGFRRKVETYMAAYSVAGPKLKADLAGRLAGKVIRGTPFHYNVKLRVLRAFHQDADTREAIRPVVQEVCRKWDSCASRYLGTKWTCIVIGGLVTFGFAGMVFAVYRLGACETRRDWIGALILSLGVAAIDSLLVLVTWYVAKPNPRLVFFEEELDRVLQTLERGEAPTVVTEGEREGEASAPGFQEIRLESAP